MHLVERKLPYYLMSPRKHQQYDNNLLRWYTGMFLRSTETLAVRGSAKIMAGKVSPKDRFHPRTNIEILAFVRANSLSRRTNDHIVNFSAIMFCILVILVPLLTLSVDSWQCFISPSHHALLLTDLFSRLAQKLLNYEWSLNKRKWLM